MAPAGPYASLQLAPDRYHTSSSPLSFLQAGCPSCRPTNSVKALKAEILHGVQNSKTGYLILTTPLSGKIFFGRVGLAMISQCTKFEVSRFTRYDAMNGGAKCRKWGSLEQLGGTQGHRQCHHSIERIRLPIRL